MRYTLLYIYAVAILVLSSCKDEASSIITEGQENGLVLSGINATIIGGDGLSGSETTRAALSNRLSYSNDYIGRSDFKPNEKIVLTTFKRTANTIADYFYTNILYSEVNSAWNRIDSYDGYEKRERIYWSDNASPHTCIGFCTPNSWIDTNTTGTVAYRSDKWHKEGTTNVYTGAFTLTEEPVGTGGNTRQVVDFTAANDDLEDISSSNTNKIDRTGTKLQNEDLLLYHKLDQQADIGGMTATLGFRHALASLRVIIDIREFAANQKDKETRIYNLELLNQPYKYKWTQTEVEYELYKKGETGLKPEKIGWGVQKNGDETTTIKTWQPRPAGEGSGEDRIFTFYSLIVPGIQQTLNMRYMVNYPDALTNEPKENTYQASLNIPQAEGGIRFIPGYTTTVRVSLNHAGEPIYIGAEFIDWENVETPDQSELQKVSTFLDTNDMTEVTMASQLTATKEDATWLYYETNADGSKTLKDIYGHVGSEADPFIIKNARQILSFAKEVNNGRTFNGLYVKLEADLFLQPENNESKWTIEWPGIGNGTSKYFDGTFLGGMRIIKLLKGKPLFDRIGPNAHIETLQLDDVIGPIEGNGCLANMNDGILNGCLVSAKNNKVVQLNSTGNYSGFVCGENKGTIVACKAQGDFNSKSQSSAGITGNNSGTIVASIAINTITSSYSGTKAFGGIYANNTSSGVIEYCRFDKDKMKDVTPVDAVNGLTTTEMQKENVVTELNNTISAWCSTDASRQKFSTRQFSSHVGQYPRIKQ